MAAGLACSLPIGPSLPPTPGPFPVEGVRQLTNDFAYYHKLLWSPAGEWIAAGRCPVVNFQPNCLEEQETVLLDPNSGDARSVDVRSSLSGRTLSFPIDWYPDGSRLLMYLAEWKAGTASGYDYKYVIYSPSSGDTDDLLFDGTIIAWDASGERLLVTMPLEGDEWSLGWLDPSTGKLTTDLRYRGADRPLGDYALSPDDRILLQGDTPLPATCRRVFAYVLGSGRPFHVFMQEACFPAWAPDGSRLAYASPSSQGAQTLRLMVSDADGSGAHPVFATEFPGSLASPAWSHDGERIVFTNAGQGNANAVFVAAAP